MAVTKSIPQPFSGGRSLPAGLMLRENYLVKMSKEVSRKPIQIQMGVFPDGRYRGVLKTTVCGKNTFNKHVYNESLKWQIELS